MNPEAAERYPSLLDLVQIETRPRPIPIVSVEGRAERAQERIVLYLPVTESN